MRVSVTGRWGSQLKHGFYGVPGNSNQTLTTQFELYKGAFKPFNWITSTTSISLQPY